MTPAQLQFPANVYATALRLAFGRAEFTGFGIAGADEAAASVPDMQRALATELTAKLPAAPATILEVGSGLGTLAMELADAGYQVQAISPDATEIDLLHQAARERGLIVAADVASFEMFKAPHPYDVILLHNSVHYINPLSLLAGARLMLKPGGRLLLADQFIEAPEDIRVSPVPVLQNFLQLATRLGYHLQDQSHYDGHLALQPFLEVLARHAVQIQSECAVSADELDALQVSMQDDIERFSAGELSVVLLHLDLPQHSALSGETFGDITDFEPGEIAQLFERSFGVPFDPAIWHWKYGEGRGRAVCIRQEGNVVAHYGGAPRDILYFGRPSKAIQICDVMVLPERRSFYSREGLFFRSAATFLEQQVGFTAEHLLGIGFPNIKAMHIAERLGLYEKTDDFIEVVYPPLESEVVASSATLHAQALAPDDISMAEIDTLWKEMHLAFPDAVVGVRDARYFHYRYVAHPRTYQALIVSDMGQRIRGLLVTRPHGDETLLMDVLAARDDMTAIIQAGQRYLQAGAGADPRLRCWITRAFAGWVMTPGAQLRDMQIEIPCNRWSPGPATAQLKGAWWLTAGDMDFL